MKRQSVISDVVREQVAADYAAGMMVFDISCKHRVSETSVCRIAREKGLTPHGRGCKARGEEKKGA